MAEDRVKLEDMAWACFCEAERIRVAQACYCTKPIPSEIRRAETFEATARLLETIRPHAREVGELIRRLRADGQKASHSVDGD